MTTGATGQLGLALPVQGELSGTWGDTVNNGITQYTNIAIAGTLTLTNDGAVTLANTTGDASASNITSSLTGAGTVTAQFAIVKVTGTLTTAKVVTGPSYSKTYTVVNSATGGIVTFKASGQTGVSIAVGETAFVYFNGTDYVKVVGTATAGAAGGSNTQVQFNSSGVLAGDADLTFDGTTLSTAGLTASGTVTLSGGTANGVAYLNGSKVVTSGSALTFDGTTLVSGTGIRANSYMEIRSNTSTLYWENAANTLYWAQKLTGSDFAWDYFNGTSNSEQMRLTSTGLGIGTSTAYSKLYLKQPGNGSGVAGFVIENSANDNRLAQYFDGSGDEWRITASYGTTGAFKPITFWTSDTKRLTLDSSGNLGLGVTPSAWTAGKALEIGTGNGNAIWGLGAGNIYLTANAYYDSAFKYATTQAAALYNIYNNSHAWFIAPSGTAGNAITFTQAMTLDADGDLGIGTTTPAVKLHTYAATGTNGFRMQSGGTSAGETNRISFVNATGATDVRSGVIEWFESGTFLGDLRFLKAGGIEIRNSADSATLNLDNSGNLGLGVTPNAWNTSRKVFQGTGGSLMLTSGNNSLAVLFANTFENTSGSYRYQNTGSASYYQQYNSVHSWYTAPSGTAGNAITFTQAMTLDASGNLALGRTSVSPIGTDYRTVDLDGLNGSGIKFRSNGTSIGYVYSSTTSFLDFGTAGAYPLTLSTNGSERARITSDGNVGIGTTSPSQKLVVYEASTSVYSVTQTGAAGAYAIFLARNPNNDLYLWNRGDNNTSVLYSTAWDLQITTEATKYISFATNNTERARINGAGNFMIGTTTAGEGGAAKLTVTGNSVVFNPNTDGASTHVFTTAAADDGTYAIRNAGGSVKVYIKANGDSYFTGGNLLVGTTSVISAGKYSSSFAGATENGIILQTTLASTGSTYIGFVNSSGSIIGSVTQNGASTVAYNTSSDYRLKNTITPMTDALAKVALLKPVTYKWNADGSDGQGFIAHELQSVVPECVTGEKDGVDANGNPKYQGIDTSFLVATLTAAIQEQQAIIESLKARLDAANL
jgi:hypothetical protein